MSSSAGKTADVGKGQMKAVIPPGASDWPKLVLAYKPVGAVGAGFVATPLQAQEARCQVRTVLRDESASSTAAP